MFWLYKEQIRNEELENYRQTTMKSYLKGPFPDFWVPAIPLTGKQPSSLHRTHSTSLSRTPAVCSAGIPVPFWDFFSQDNGFWNRCCFPKAEGRQEDVLKAFKLRPQTTFSKRSVEISAGLLHLAILKCTLTLGQSLRLHILFQTWQRGRSLPLVCLD